MFKQLNSEYAKIETIVGYDCSYSTSPSCNGFDTSFYHSKTQSIVKDLDPAKTLFMRWDNSHNQITKNELENINRMKKGFGGTSPVSFFQFIKSIGFRGKLIFISDGQIPENCAQQCSEILMDWKFEYINIYLIYTGGAINESVSCALTRNSPHTVENYRDISNRTVVNVSNTDFEFVYKLDSIKTIEEFLDNKETLKNVLISINMGTSGNKELHTKLVDLKNRLVKYESKSFLKTADNPVTRLIESFNSQNFDQLSTAELDKVWKMYYKIEDSASDDDNDWKKLIDKFISWCAGSLINAFDRNKITNREAKAVTVPVIPTETAEIVESLDSLEGLETGMNNLNLTCPITLEESSNFVILMKKSHSSIFEDLPTNVRDSLINCPLNILRNHDLLNYIKSLLDCVISLEAYQELVEYGMSDKSPLTRNEIFGGLCLGKDKSHVQVTNSTLRYALSSGKSLGNIDLWFAVIYFIVKRDMADHLKEYLPLLEEHLKYRLVNSKSYMCLSGLPNYPTYSVPLGLAIWTSVMATTSQVSIIRDPKNDPIRLHLSYSLDLIELLEILKITVPAELIQHIHRLKTLRYFLLEIKKGKDILFKTKNLIEALSYNAIETDNLWVLIDGEISDEQIESVINKLPTFTSPLEVSEIHDIFKLCENGVNKTESDIYIPYKFDVKSSLKSKVKNWSFDENIPTHKVPICPQTCRPYSTVLENGKMRTWLEKAHEIYGSELFSTNNFFGNYVFNNKKYPNKSEFLNHIFLYHYTREKTTLPICVEQFVDEVFTDYEDILKTVNPDDFAYRWNNSVHKEERKRLESGFGFRPSVTEF